MYVWVSVCHSMGVEVKRQLARLISLFYHVGHRRHTSLGLAVGAHTISLAPKLIFFTSNFLMLNLRMKTLYKTNFFFLEFRI